VRTVASPIAGGIVPKGEFGLPGFGAGGAGIEPAWPGLHDLTGLEELV
jgi:hypothetical protein